MGHRWRFSLPLASFSRCIIITMVCNETKSADVNVDHHIVLILKKGTDMGDHTGISVKHDFSNVFTEGHETVLAELEKTRILRNNIPIAGYTGCLPWTNFVKLRSLSARCKVVHAHIYLHMYIYVYFLRQTLLSPAGVNMIRPRKKKHTHKRGLRPFARVLPQKKTTQQHANTSLPQHHTFTFVLYNILLFFQYFF